MGRLGTTASTHMEEPSINATEDLKQPSVAHHADAAEDAQCEKDKKSLGGRNIGPWGGGVLMLNNMFGPAIIQLPVLYQQAGWFVPTVLMIVCYLLSGFASTYLTEAMTLVPGNARLRERMELTTLSERMVARKFHMVIVFLFVVSLEAVNIAQILVSAQTMDMALVAIKGSCALEIYPKFKGVCVYTPGNGIQPFGDVYVITIGFIIILLIAIPLGYLNLEDNIWVQWAAIIIMFIIFFEWIICFAFVGINPRRVGFIGSFANCVNVLGTIVFNYAYVITVPSWVNEKRKSVSVNKTIWWSGTVATALYFGFGFLGSWTFTFQNSETLLDVINTAQHIPKWLHILSSVFVYIFPIATQVSSIPVMSIIIRYNLITSGFCHTRWANFWAVIFPWIVSAPFYTGAGFSDVIQWTGLVVNGFLNFSIPLVLYLIAKRRHEKKAQSLLHATEEGHEAIQFTRARSCTFTDTDGLDYKMEAIPPRCQRCLKPVAFAWFLAIFTTVLVTLAIIANIVFAIIPAPGTVSPPPPAPPVVAVPGVMFTIPVDRAEHIVPSANITVAFTQKMDLKPSQAAFATEPPIPVMFLWTNDGRTLTAMPTASMEGGVTYAVTVSTGARSDAGTPLSDDLKFEFTTATIPHVVAVLPERNTHNVSTTLCCVTMSFTEYLSPLDVSVVTAATGLPVAGNMTMSPGLLEAEFRFLAPLEPATTYDVQAHGRSEYGVPLPPFSSPFTTANKTR